MSRQYTKIKILTEEILQRKASGETKREIGESYGLTKKQIHNLITRYNRKMRLIANGYVPRSKGRPRKDIPSNDINHNNELAELRMKVELLQNFLSEVGRK